ncbi:MAG: MFS transporter [Anaerolineae bacterium]|nr:MFS transporter [Anaerolineae bacterium]
MSQLPRQGEAASPGEERTASLPTLFLSFYLPAVLLAFSSGLIVPVIPLYARDFGVSYGLVGLVSGGAALGMLLGDLPSGLVVRRLGQKPTVLLGVGCHVASTVALFWARSVPEVVAFRLLSGLGQALYSVARHAYIAGAVQVSGRGRAIALFGGVARVGRFVGPLLGGVVAQAYGLRVPFLLFGVTGAAALACMAVWMPAHEEHTMVAALATARRVPLWQMLRDRWGLLASAGAGQLFAQMIRAGRTIVIPLYGADALGLDVRAIGTIVSLSSAIDMLFFYPAGWIMDRLGRKWAIVPSFCLQAAGMALLPLAAGYGGLLLAALLIGFGNGLGSGSMMTLGADLAPTGVRGEFLGVWRLIGDLGSSGGPLIVGAIADLVALPAAALIMAAAGLLAGMVFGLLVPETLRREDASSPT